MLVDPEHRGAVELVHAGDRHGAVVRIQQRVEYQSELERKKRVSSSAETPAAPQLTIQNFQLRSVRSVT